MHGEECGLPEALRGVAALLAGVLGPHAEVVVHDLARSEILFIENGELTGRAPGPTDDGDSIRLLAEDADENGCLIGYRSSGKASRPLRSSNLFLRDEAGRLRYAVCVNQDVAPFQQARLLLDELSGTAAPAAPAPDGEGATLRQLARSILLQEIERAKPFSISTREGRLAVLARLEEKGVFDMRDAVPQVCELLHISQATLYNYQRELRGEEKKRDRG